MPTLNSPWWGILPKNLDSHWVIQQLGMAAVGMQKKTYYLILNYLLLIQVYDSLLLGVCALLTAPVSSESQNKAKYKFGERTDKAKGSSG